MLFTPYENGLWPAPDIPDETFPTNFQHGDIFFFVQYHGSRFLSDGSARGWGYKRRLSHPSVGQSWARLDFLFRTFSYFIQSFASKKSWACLDFSILHILYFNRWEFSFLHILYFSRSDFSFSQIFIFQSFACKKQFYWRHFLQANQLRIQNYWLVKDIFAESPNKLWFASYNWLLDRSMLLLQ